MSIRSAGLDLSDAAASVLSRFEAKCAEPDDAGCVEWLGAKTNGGYGVFRIEAARTTAHRVVWALKRGVIPPEILVLHRCDNPSCVNVDHLFLGLPKANTADMIKKCRHGWKNGTPWQKLNKTDAERIKDLHWAGLTQQRIADWMFVSRPLVSLVLSGKLHNR